MVYLKHEHCQTQLPPNLFSVGLNLFWAALIKVPMAHFTVTRRSRLLYDYYYIKNL